MHVATSDIIISKESLNMKVGDEYKIQANVLPEDAIDNTITFSSSNENVAIVSKEGIVKAISSGKCDILIESDEIKKICKVLVTEKTETTILEFDESLKITVDEITGIDCTVEEFKKLISTNLIMEIYNVKDKVLGDTDYIGTGSKLILKDENNDVLYEYTFIKYGDVNGDGLINSLDPLILQKHILEIKLLSGSFLKAR